MMLPFASTTIFPTDMPPAMAPATTRLMSSCFTRALQRALDVTYPGAKLFPVMSSGGTEGREYRRAGIPTFGAGSLGLVQPVDSRAHGTDERIPLKAFDKELDYWSTLLGTLGGKRAR
jgi:acetylornithine deacetylase/succinyl-diaminopimelate desuccinylase-like protein